jgi:triacylglycerol lipase
MKMTWLLRSTLALLLLAAAAWGWFWWQRGQPGWAIAGALLIALAHVPVMALEFTLLHHLNAGDPAPPPTGAELLRAWAGEAVGAVAVFGWRQPFRAAAFADQLPADGTGHRGVVLIHGFICNRALWNPWWPRLRAAGIPCIAVNLEPVFGSIDAYAPRIEQAVRQLTACTGRPPLLVAHSMGGLALRAWLRAYDGAARMHGAVTVGTPHRGTRLARFGLMPNARQMELDSDWLRRLADDEPGEALYRRFTCFYSHTDNVVVPCSTATLPGADNRHLRAQAHVQLLQHPDVWAAVLQRLGEADAAPASTGSASMAGLPLRAP